VPQDFVSTGDGYTRRYNQVVANIGNKTKCIDNVGRWEDDIEKSFFQACHWMDRCGRNRITQNLAKFHFAMDTVEFASFEIMRSCIRLSNTFIIVIRDNPTTSLTSSLCSG
jgi:hypothetical protein